MARRTKMTTGSAVSVHGFKWLWGLISVGRFADGTSGHYSTHAPFAIVFFIFRAVWSVFAQVIGTLPAIMAFLWRRPV